VHCFRQILVRGLPSAPARRPRHLLITAYHGLVVAVEARSLSFNWQLLSPVAEQLLYVSVSHPSLKCWPCTRVLTLLALVQVRAARVRPQEAAGVRQSLCGLL
jgi:hypothetical protein